MFTGKLVGPTSTRAPRPRVTRIARSNAARPHLQRPVFISSYNDDECERVPRLLVAPVAIEMALLWCLLNANIQTVTSILRFTA
jgi:hypothetical protein